MREAVTFGDLVPDVLSGFNSVARNIYTPIIKSDKRNVSQIPDVAVNELMSDTDNLLSHLLITLGLSQSKTLLPLPPVTLPASLDANRIDKELLYTLESTIVTWTNQIKSAMTSSP